MAMLESALENLAAYPRWFVALCGIIVAVAGLWVLVKVLKWTIYLAALAILVLLAGGLVVWWWEGGAP